MDGEYLTAALAFLSLAVLTFGIRKRLAQGSNAEFDTSDPQRMGPGTRLLFIWALILVTAGVGTALFVYSIILGPL